MNCIHCGQPMDPERALIKPYCMSSGCVALGLSQARAQYRLILMPKQGFGIVNKDSDDLKNGKSSGRN